MTVAAPPKPKRPPTQPEPEALIEEARRRTRRRTRRRRLKYAASGLGALLLAGAIFGAITLSGGGRLSAEAVPPGFGLVQATGRVTHYVVELGGRNQPTTIDLRTGAARPAPHTQEIWWESKSPFFRVVDRVDGQVTFDLVGNRCIPVTGPPGGKLCNPSPPYELGFSGLHWPLDSKQVQVHVLGRGTFRAAASR